MAQSTAVSSLDILRRAAQQAFPQRADLAALKLEGSTAQAWQVVTRQLGIDGIELAAKLAPIYGVPLAGALNRCDPVAVGKIPFNFCQSNQVLPLRIEGGALVVATADPLDTSITERTAFLANRPVRWVLAPPEAIDEAVFLAYAQEASRASAIGPGGPGGPNAAIDDNAITKLARSLLQEAVAQRASDLHIQSFMGAAVVRVRVDGSLRRLTMLSDAVAATLIRHYKARSGMDSTNSQIPQDGRMSLVVNERDFDLRVSTLPANRGERIVIRFLDQSRVHRLSGAGFSLAALQVLRKAIHRPSGMVIITGPTGSGKTSTLYGMLAEVNRSTVNIITVENPVEYRIAGISQVEVNEKAGRTFQAALRSILRQDPDVVLIGEIRDQETAEIAAQAALTGHLVLSTLHTNDALTSIPRLLNLGVQPSILADSLAAIASQRLCRVLCTECKTPVVEPLKPEERVFLEVTHNRPAHRPVGCAHCDFTGYRGRLPIIEIILMNKRLRDAIAQGEGQLAVLEGLRDGGLRSLAASGAQRVISGDTTVSEVMAVVGPGFWPELAQHFGTVLQTDIDLQDEAPGSVGQGILLMSPDAALAAQLAPGLEAEGLRLVQAATAEEAKLQLQRDEDIVFIIGDLEEGIGLQAAVQRLQHNRLHISWARLPSVVLIPATLAGREAELRASGVMADFLAKPVTLEAVRSQVRQAQAR